MVVSDNQDEIRTLVFLCCYVVHMKCLCQTKNNLIRPAILFNFGEVHVTSMSLTALDPIRPAVWVGFFDVSVTCPDKTDGLLESDWLVV